MMNLTLDQAGKTFDLKEKMHTGTAGQRKQMMVTHAALAALGKMEKPDQTAIQAKQKELTVLRDQREKKMTALWLEAKKIAPDCPVDMGIGHSCCMGPGCMFMAPGAGLPPPPPPAT